MRSRCWISTSGWAASMRRSRAIAGSVLHDRGLSFSVEIARQGGKNELSARLELLLLLRNADRPVTAI